MHVGLGVLGGQGGSGLCHGGLQVGSGGHGILGGFSVGLGGFGGVGGGNFGLHIGVLLLGSLGLHIGSVDPLGTQGRQAPFGFFGSTQTIFVMSNVTCLFGTS